MNSLKIALGIALAMAMSGCGLARVYNKVTLGEPLPADLGLTEVIDEDAAADDDASQERRFGLCEYYVWHTPLTTSVHGVTVLTDATDRVTSRSLNTWTVTNWLVLLGVSMTQTVEVAVPPQLMADPKDATLAQVLTEEMFTQSDSDITKRAEEALRLTSYGLNGHQAMMFPHSITYGCLMGMPLADLPKAGSSKTVLPHATGVITVTNLGNNRLRIETCTWLLTDPSGMTTTYAFMLFNGGL
jgi:hypothetical protein